MTDNERQALQDQVAELTTRNGRLTAALKDVTHELSMQVALRFGIDLKQSEQHETVKYARRVLAAEGAREPQEAEPQQPEQRNPLLTIGDLRKALADFAKVSEGGNNTPVLVPVGVYTQRYAPVQLKVDYIDFGYGALCLHVDLPKGMTISDRRKTLLTPAEDADVDAAKPLHKNWER